GDDLRVDRPGASGASGPRGELRAGERDRKFAFTFTFTRKRSIVPRHLPVHPPINLRPLRIHQIRSELEMVVVDEILSHDGELEAFRRPVREPEIELAVAADLETRDRSDQPVGGVGFPLRERGELGAKEELLVERLTALGEEDDVLALLRSPDPE